MIDGIPNRPLYFYQKDIIARVVFGAMFQVIKMRGIKPRSMPIDPQWNPAEENLLQLGGTRSAPETL